MAACDSWFELELLQGGEHAAALAASADGVLEIILSGTTPQPIVKVRKRIKTGAKVTFRVTADGADGKSRRVTVKIKAAA